MLVSWGLRIFFLILRGLLFVCRTGAGSPVRVGGVAGSAACGAAGVGGAGGALPLFGGWVPGGRFFVTGEQLHGGGVCCIFCAAVYFAEGVVSEG